MMTLLLSSGCRILLRCMGFFLSKVKGLEAIGYNAQDVTFRQGYVVLLREKLARVKAVLDVLVGKGPKFYGPKVAIGNA